jgi:putative transposase
VRTVLRENRFALVEERGLRLGVAALCRALAVSRATLYRRRSPRTPGSHRRSARALSPGERLAVLQTLHSDRFVDDAPASITARLLDEGTYLCSARTMYRILSVEGESRERRDQLRHPAYAKPELLATGPNQLWSWDITKLLGPAKWTYFYLYVLLDVFSRYVTGWMVAYRESATLAARLIDEACRRQRISSGQLTVHADRGSSMTSKTVALLLADLGVTKTHSRPHVSDDNPYSESQFKTLKYRPAFPDRFGSLQHARAWCAPFFQWYNHEHRHSGIAYLTPADVHLGRAEATLRRREEVLAEASRQHPERFVRGAARLPQLPEAVWINRPVTPGDPGKGGCSDMDPSIISQPEAGQRPPLTVEPPLSPLSPRSPLSLFSPPRRTSPATRVMSLEDLH